MRNKANRAIATGRLKVIAGIRLPLTFDGLFPLVACVVKELPHTKQRSASSLTRVPHTGHIFVGLDGDSMVIVEFLMCQLVLANQY